MPDATATLCASTGEQLDLIDLASFSGFGELSRREQLFAEGIFSGLTQRAAAAHAGVTGPTEQLDQAGHTMMRNPRVQRVLAQAWQKSGASIHKTLAQAAHLQQIAYDQAVRADTAKARETAMRQWKDASTLIASIHGKLAVRIEGNVTHDHHHSGAVTTIPAEALPAFAEIRRAVIVERMTPAAPILEATPS